MRSLGGAGDGCLLERDSRQMQLRIHRDCKYPAKEPSQVFGFQSSQQCLHLEFRFSELQIASLSWDSTFDGSQTGTS